MFIVWLHLTERMTAVRQTVSFVSSIHSQQPFTVFGILVFEDVVGHIVQDKCARTLNLRRLMSQLLRVRKPSNHSSLCRVFLSVIHMYLFFCILMRRIYFMLFAGFLSFRVLFQRSTCTLRNLLHTLFDDLLGTAVFRIKFRPAFGIFYRLFFLIKILVCVCHAHVPLRIFLSFTAHSLHKPYCL